MTKRAAKIYLAKRLGQYLECNLYKYAYCGQLGGFNIVQKFI